MFEKVRKSFAEQLRISEDKIQLTSHIRNDLGADSLDVFQLLMTIEEEYGITIPDDKLATFSTVGDIVNYLESIGLK